MTPVARALTAAAISLGAATAARAQAPVRIYVANQESASVTILDAGTRSAVTTLDLRALGYSANCKPHHIVVEPDGSFWYVSLIADGRVVKFDRDNRVVGEVRTEVPGMLALDPASDRLVVGRSMSAVNPPSRVMIIRRSTMTVEEEIDVPYPRPHANTLGHDGAWAYSASLAQNTLAAINIRTGDVRVLPIDGPLHTIVQFAVSPDGRWLVGSGQMSGQLLVWDLRDPGQPRQTASLPVGGSPWDPVFTPDGREVWLANLDSNTVTVIDARRWIVARVIRDRRLMQPNGINVSPDGRFVFVSNRNQHGPAHLHDGMPGAGEGSVAILDARAHRVLNVVPAGRYAIGIGAPAPRSR